MPADAEDAARTMELIDRVHEACGIGVRPTTREIDATREVEAALWTTRCRVAVTRGRESDWDSCGVTTPVLDPEAAPAVRARARRIRARSPWLLGPVAALWTAGIGLVIAVIPPLVIWMTTVESGLGLPDAIGYAGVVWTVGHGVPLTIAGVTYSLLPWGLAIVPLLLMFAGGSWAAHAGRLASVREVAIVAVSASLGYAGLVGIVAGLAGSDGDVVRPVTGAIHGLFLGLLGFGTGALRASSVELEDLAPSWAITTVRASLIAVMSMLGMSAVAAAAALMVRVDDAVTMTQSLEPGLWGGLALLVLAIAYLPVLVVWSVAYLLGVGVVVGPAVVVSPFIAATAPTQLPAFPLLAALPQSASPLAWALPLTGVLAGVLAGILIGRRLRAETRLLRLAAALGAAAIAAGILALLADLASGSLGDQRLIMLGPAPTAVGVLAFVLMTLGAVPSAVVPSPPALPRLQVATPVPFAVPAPEHVPAPEPGASGLGDHPREEPDV